MLDEQVGDDAGHDLGPEPTVLDLGVAALDDGRDGGRIRGRPADAVLLERLDERSLGVAGWWLGEVLLTLGILDGGTLALGQGRQASLGLLVFPVVAALRVDPGEALEGGPRGAGTEAETTRFQLRAGGLHLFGGHL